MPPTDAADGTVRETPAQVEVAGSGSQEASQPVEDKSDRNQANAMFRMLKRIEQRQNEFESKFAQPKQEAQPVPSQSSIAQDDSFWSDPDKVVQMRSREQAQLVIQEYEAAKHREEANLYVQSQDDIKTEADLEAIKEVLHKSGLAHAVKAGVVSPMDAATRALKEWREGRSVQSEVSVQKTAAKIQAGGVQGNFTPGKKVWSKAEIDALSDPRDPAKWLKNRDDVEAAIREGRIKD
jgi:hypothetical protein